jgi:hypothetical protein
MPLPPVNENEYDENENDEYDEDDEDEYEKLYESKESEIKKYIENNFSKLKFSVEFPEENLIVGQSEEITQIKVNPPIAITDKFLDDVNTYDAHQVLVKFKLKVTVNYTAQVYYMSLKDKHLGMETLEKDFSNSTELDVEVTFTLPKKKNGSLCNMNIKIEPSDEEEEIVVYATDDDEYDDENE